MKPTRLGGSLGGKSIPSTLWARRRTSRSGRPTSPRPMTSETLSVSPSRLSRDAKVGYLLHRLDVGLLQLLPSSGDEKLLSFGGAKSGFLGIIQYGCECLREGNRREIP